MTNVFIETLRPILILCKFLGIINTSYYLESDGLLIQSTNSTYYSFLEFIKTFVLIIFTYNVHKHLIFIEVLCLYKIWIVIITSRISENWIIKYVTFLISTNYMKCVYVCVFKYLDMITKCRRIDKHVLNLLPIINISGNNGQNTL